MSDTAERLVESAISEALPGRTSANAAIKDLKKVLQVVRGVANKFRKPKDSDIKAALDHLEEVEDDLERAIDLFGSASAD